MFLFGRRIRRYNPRDFKNRTRLGSNFATDLFGLGFCHGHALILYVYLPMGDDEAARGSDESVLTYYVTSYST